MWRTCVQAAWPLGDFPWDDRVAQVCSDKRKRREENCSLEINFHTDAAKYVSHVWMMMVGFVVRRKYRWWSDWMTLDVVTIYNKHNLGLLPVFAVMSAISLMVFRSSLGLDVAGIPPCLRWFLCCCCFKAWRRRTTTTRVRASTTRRKTAERANVCNPPSPSNYAPGATRLVK